MKILLFFEVLADSDTVFSRLISKHGGRRARAQLTRLDLELLVRKCFDRFPYIRSCLIEKRNARFQMLNIWFN